MLNADTEAPSTLGLIDYADAVVAEKMAHGRMNTVEAILHDNIARAIRRGHPQMRTGPVRPDRVCIVGSGPSLADTEDELRQLIWDGATLITLNGAYHWCRERNFRPQTQIVMDARPSNARFVTPYVPKCNYVLASQCAPELWETVRDYPNVWIFHPVVKDEGASSKILDDYYCGNWIGIGGGTTVATRAISLLRMAGYVRFDLFGIDCCWMGESHHAFPQPENDRDNRATVTMSAKDSDYARTFTCSAWHLKQLDDLLVTMKVNGQHFTLTAHGDGMFAHALRMLGTADADSLTITKE